MKAVQLLLGVLILAAVAITFVTSLPSDLRGIVPGGSALAPTLGILTVVGILFLSYGLAGKTAAT